MVPGEIVEEIFAYLSRDALDYCEIICLKWSKFIESSKRLSQRRIVSLDYNIYYPDEDRNDPFWMELKSSTSKTIRIVDDPSQQELPASRVFKNVIIDKLIEKDLCNIDFLEERWMKIFKLVGARMIVKSVYLKTYTTIFVHLENIKLKQLHDLLAKYIDADEITMRFDLPGYVDDEDNLLFNKESWKYFDFGKKTEFNFHYISNISPNGFSNDTFKEFISGKHMEHPMLNELQISFYRIDIHVIIHLIVEAFCNTDEPLKFFKRITSYPPRNFDEILGKFGFVREDRDAQKYRLSHPKLNWALEATLTQPSCGYLKLKSIEL